MSLGFRSELRQYLAGGVLTEYGVVFLLALEFPGSPISTPEQAKNTTQRRIIGSRNRSR
jgi:hypothetical protein